MINILLVEDNPGQKRIMTAFLRSAGYDVTACEDASEALAALEKRKIDMAICDVMLPGMNGFELTRELRAYDAEMPILLTTAKGEPEDKERGFLAGTDDYMVKPVELNELLLRVKALLRRSRIREDRVVEFGETRICLDDCTVRRGDMSVALKRREFQLLYMLANNRDTILTRRQLMDSVWGVDCETDWRTVDVHIKRLREKLGFASEISLETVRGLGYMLEVKNV